MQTKGTETGGPAVIRSFCLRKARSRLKVRKAANGEETIRYEGRERAPETGRRVKGRLSLRNLRTFSSLKSPLYRLYFIGMTGHWASINMEMMSRSLLIYRLTGSATLLGVMALANALPMLFFSLIGGVIADRVQKKYVLLIGLASEALVSLSVALALTLGYLSAERAGSWWLLVAASFFKGTIEGLMMPSRQAMIHDIVSGEWVMNAVALNAMGMNIFRFLAPGLAGFLIDAFGFAPVYYIMTGMYVMAAFFVALIPPIHTTPVRRGSAVVDIKEGLLYMRSDTTILLLLIFTLSIVVLSLPYTNLMPIFADDILKVGAKGMGILLSASGIGALTGSLVLASLPNKRRGAMLFIISLILGLSLVAFAFSRSWYLSLALVAFAGLGQTGRQTLGNTLLQYYARNDYLGRVMSIFMMERGLSSLGTFFAALIAERMGAQWAVGGFAMVLALLSIFGLAFVPRIRKLD